MEIKKFDITLIYLTLSTLISFTSCKEKTSATLESTTQSQEFTWVKGGIIRGESSERRIALMFSGDEFADGGETILNTLKEEEILASFFFTGNFYRDPDFKNIIENLKAQGHYLGAHSDKHLLYCSWENRDSLLVTKEEFELDLMGNYGEMEKFGIDPEDSQFFLPPYEWYNDSISQWTQELGFQLINFTPGTLSHADYTTPDLKNYRSNEVILKSILNYEKEKGLKGFLLLSHIGVAPTREEKFYLELKSLIQDLKTKGYQFVKVDELLSKY